MRLALVREGARSLVFTEMMMASSQRNLRGRRAAGSFSVLYREFAGYYALHHCPEAPARPRRLFNLCVKKIYPACRSRITPPEFMGAVYDILGVRCGQPKGLFQSFDPAKYRGALPLENHFVNLFARKLRGKLARASKPAGDGGRRGNPEKFFCRPELGLIKEEVRSRRDREMAESVIEAIEVLESHERLVIHMTYWEELSNRKIGEILGIDHKTVRSKHDRAIRKLRRYYAASA
jgi:RNA polymerase sigma factor (sigma-70 family)